MFLNSWSLALTISSITVLTLVIIAGRTSIRVLRFWDPASDSSLQIRLENETWLAATLVEYALGFQIITLVLFILAADNFCQVIVGAMCATGALLANGWGVPALLVKLLALFLYGFWIVLHKLDISSENYPLVSSKFYYLLFLIPILLIDIILQTFYIANLDPDIITSCCAVVFGTSKGGNQNLIEGFNQTSILILFYCSILLLLIAAVISVNRLQNLLLYLYCFLWIWFFGLALVAIISVFSSYIYAMPFHNCPFCIIKPEYNYIGFALYGSLIVATFFGISPALVDSLKQKTGLHKTINRYQKTGIKISAGLLIIFTLIASFHYVLYFFAGGEY